MEDKDRNKSKDRVPPLAQNRWLLGRMVVLEGRRAPPEEVCRVRRLLQLVDSNNPPYFLFFFVANLH